MRLRTYLIVFIFISLVRMDGYGQTQLENEVIEALLNKGNEFIPRYKISRRKGRVKTFNRRKLPAFVLLNVTKNPVNESEFDTISMFERKVLMEEDKGMLQDFCVKNMTPLLLSYGVGRKVPITYLRNAELIKLFPQKENWRSYYKKYEFKPLVTISRPGFNQTKNKAFIYLSYTLGKNDGAGYYLVLEKSWGKWKPRGNMLVWVL